mmetsp:Transcript_24494/g.71625  ORF Transcript_24494/g.71625 Transcript_24494/m.71625 type:complete len:518 (-) Transcript_24494:173-1726(-)
MSAAGGTHPPAVQPPAEPSCLLQQGTLDDYVVEKAIGRGHFSVVHRAQRRSDDRRVALKKIKIFDMMDAKARDRCLKEVQLLQTLEAHPSIIQYLDAFLADNVLYIVFEWAEHGDLRRLLRRAAECSASLREPQIWRYFTQVCDGIRHMHAARVMHRDIKPANIFLAADGRVKLGDLGLGRAFSSQTYEAMSKVGTPLYMSPEVLDGRGYEWKSDIWSLGCLLYELATLRSPFKSQGEKDNLFSLFKKISVGKFAALPDRYSEQLAALVTWMIQTDPSRRPDIQQTLDAANAAEALAQEAAARPQSGGRSGGGGGGARRDDDLRLAQQLPPHGVASRRLLEDAILCNLLARAPLHLAVPPPVIRVARRAIEGLELRRLEHLRQLLVDPRVVLVHLCSAAVRAVRLGLQRRKLLDEREERPHRLETAVPRLSIQLRPRALPLALEVGSEEQVAILARVLRLVLRGHEVAARGGELLLELVDLRAKGVLLRLLGRLLRLGVRHPLAVGHGAVACGCLGL